MFRLAALNERKTEIVSEDQESQIKGTKEAQEVQAFDLYNQALSLQQSNRYEDALAVYEKLLKTALIAESTSKLVDEQGEAKEHPLKDPGLILKYSTHKNVANISASKGDSEAAMEHYLQAVMLDTSDVTLWYKIGKLASGMGKLSLSRYAFTQGLNCSSNHWPCLDNLITILYALLDYEHCLLWISKAFKLDPFYTKGIAFREKMFLECPHLRKDTSHLFTNWNGSHEIDTDEYSQYLEEAHALRSQWSAGNKPIENSDVPLTLKAMTWCDLGKSLLSTYKYIQSCEEPISVTSKIIFNSCSKQSGDLDSELENFPNIPKPAFAITDSPVAESLKTGTESVHSDAKLKQNDMSVDSTEVKKCNTVLESSTSDETDPIESTGSSSHPVSKSFISTLPASYSNEITSSQSQLEAYDSPISPSLSSKISQWQSTLKKGVKRKRVLFDKEISQQEQQNKRRSSRVRKSKDTLKSASNSEQDSVNFHKILIEFLPCTLLLKSSLNEQPDASLIERNTSAADQIEENEISEDKPIGPENGICEKDEVDEFIKSNVQNNGILDVLYRYCVALGNRVHLKWSEGTKEVFISAFRQSYPFMLLPAMSDSETDNKWKRANLFYVLAYLETAVDSEVTKNVSKASVKCINECMYYLASGLCGSSLFEDSEKPWYNSLAFKVRFHWMRAQYCSLLKNSKSAADEIKDVIALINSSQQDNSPQTISIQLPNLINENEINLGLAVNKLKRIERIQTLEQVEQLFAMKKYSDVISLYKPAMEMLDASESVLDFSSNFSSLKDSTSLLHRPELLQCLVLSYEKIRTSTETLRAIDFVLSEAISAVFNLGNSRLSSPYKGSISAKLHDEWNSLIHMLCQRLETFFKIESSILVAMPKSQMFHLTKSLLSVAKYAMTTLQQQVAMHFSICTTAIPKDFMFSSLPWILFYRTLKLVEKTLGNDAESSKQPFPGSVRFLVMLHDWLGEKGICCIDEGKILDIFLSDAIFLLEKTGSMSITSTAVDLNNGDAANDLKTASGKLVNEHLKYLQADIEQCFFCISGYPTKISKSSRLLDHSSQQPELTWSIALKLYQYYCPKSLPGFDSYKASTMTSELAALLLRIVEVIPTNLKTLLVNSVEVVKKFISQGDQENEELDLNFPQDCCFLKDIYYLLADYYFKNKDMIKAVNYYILDICINSARFDSWAGLALSKSIQVDERLRSCTTKKIGKNNNDVLSEAKGALVCFKMALGIDNTSATLWIEYGSLAYWIHSFRSRQIKLFEVYQSEKLCSVTKLNEDMLMLAEKCFQSALDCEVEDVNNEEWLIRYMLGKIMEKKKSSACTYLEQYKRSAALLHLKHAKYPKKIQFRSYQSDYAIEALELHYRLHASILKHVQLEVNVIDGYKKLESEELLDEITYNFFQDAIDEASKSNFIKRDVLPCNSLIEKVDLYLASSQSPIKTGPIHNPIKMGTLIPDSVASALSCQLEISSSQTETISTDSNTEAGIDIMSEAAFAERESDSALQNIETREVAGNLEKNMGDSDIDDVILLNDPCTDQSAEKASFTMERRKERALQIIGSCVQALHVCLERFPQHYKSLYRLAILYYDCNPERRHMTWARDLLMNSETQWQKLSHMPAQGLLAERNKTNLFNGVWRIPVDEIDRPGSFAWHLYRCILLLLEVLRVLNNHKKLFYLHTMLQRNPDQGRKYLHDSDRISASRKALKFSVEILQAKINGDLNFSTAMDEASIENKTIEPTVVNCNNTEKNLNESLDNLLEAYKLYQQTQKTGFTSLSPASDIQGSVLSNISAHKKLLVTASQQYFSKSSSDSQNCVISSMEEVNAEMDRAVKFCQNISSTKNITNSASNSSGSATKSLIKFNKTKYSNVESTNAAHLLNENCEPEVTANNHAKDQISGLNDVENCKAIHKDTSVISCSKESDNSTTDVRMENCLEEEKNGGQVTMVKMGVKTYTKITPRHNQLPKLQPSLGSAFTPTSAEKQLADHNTVHDNRSKRLKADPHLQHLLLKKDPRHSDKGIERQNKAPLIRSTSMPVTVDDKLADESDACTKFSKEEARAIHHRTIFRTGSVSDYTKQKLKTSILMRTSASLVRKPSITEQEMLHIHGDADSSQSDDDDDEEDETDMKFKPVTTDGTTDKPPDIAETESSPLSSSLSGTSVSLAIAMTTT